jgi:hypothetical protein
MDRMEMISRLVNSADMADAEYIAGNMDRDTWTKSLQEIDDKLSILNLRLAYRPWEEKRSTAGF